MPDYSIRIFQLNYFIKIYLNDLFLNFKENQIDSDIFLSKWVITVFASYLPFNTLAKVWDIFIVVSII